MSSEQQENGPIQTRFLDRFLKFGDKKSGKLHGNLLRIEIVKTPGEDESGNTKTQGGIYLAGNKNQKSDFFMLKPVIGVVLETGSGYYDPETREDIPMDLKPGNVVWVPAGSIGRLSIIPETGEGIPEAMMAFVNETEVRKSWNSLEDFNNDYKLLETGEES